METTKTHEHLLSPGLVGVLVKMIAAVKAKDANCVHLQRDMKLSHNEYANAQKLRYFGLIAHYEEMGRRASGFWLITSRGGKFLRNEIGIPIKVRTFSNHIIGKSEVLKMIKDFYPMYEPAWFQSEFGTVRLEQSSLF